MSPHEGHRRQGHGAGVCEDGLGSHQPYVHRFLFRICSAYILMPPGPHLLNRLMRESVTPLLLLGTERKADATIGTLSNGTSWFLFPWSQFLQSV